jgi:hypothetical protein
VTRADEAAAIADRLRQTVPGLHHLASCRIAWLAMPPPVMLRGWPCRACIAEPRVRGPLRVVFETLLDRWIGEEWDGQPPDYLVLVDRQAWAELGAAEDGALRQERLVYHELSHVRQLEDKYGAPVFADDGRPRWRLAPHDTEVFDEEVRRYGVTICELDALEAALEDGDRRARVRAARSA